MKIDDLLKFSEALKKSAATCAVRECDEESPGRFVAYVDEAAESYDVTLELNADRNPEAGSCDCTNKKPCRHIAALFLFVAKGEGIAAPVIAAADVKKKKPKQTPAEALLDGLSAQELGTWLLAVFASNKDLELAFVNHFGAAVDPKPEDVTRMSAEAVRTVMGRKRIPDSTQITKLLQLWKDLFKPIVERYRSAPVSREAYEALSAAADAMMEFAASHGGTARIQKHARQMIAEFATQVSLLKQDDAFFLAASYPVMSILRQSYAARITSIDYLQALGALVSGKRLEWLAETIGTQFLLHRQGRHLDGDSNYQLMVLGIVRKAGVFRDYADAFATRSWNPEFNIPLIAAWTDGGMYQLAESAAWKEIERNTKEAHNAPYYKALQAIYTASGNTSGLAKLLRQRLRQTFDFDDYLLVLQAIPDVGERREFRNELYTLARNVKSPAAKSFAIQLTVHEGNWGSILEMVAKEDLAYEDIVRLFDHLYEFNAEELIRALMQRRDWDAMYAKDQTSLRESISALVEKVMARYEPPQIRNLVTRFGISYQTRAATNMFRRAILDALGPVPPKGKAQ